MIKASQVGNSLKVTLPAELAAKHGIKSGDLLDWAEVNGRLTLIPVELRPKMRPGFKAGLDFVLDHYDETMRDLAY